MRTIICALGLIACSSTNGKSDPVDPVDSVTTDSLDPTDTDGGTPPDLPDDTDVVETLDDASRVERFLEVGGDIATFMHEIAWSGGWPVATETGFVLVVPGEGPLSVAGDFNDWVPEPMAQLHGVRWIRVQSEAPEGQGYKLVEGDVWSADPWARSYDYDEFGRLSWLRPPTDRPHLERWPDFEEQGLAKRDLNVRVPPGEGPWPTLVMHDGQNLFDPSALWGGWAMGEALDLLGEPILVVGIDNTADRLSEYTHVFDEPEGVGPVEPLGDAYADLVVLDLLPWVHGQWPTTDHAGVMGSSLGGLISLHISQRHPDAFDFVASLSGTLGWGRLGASGELMETRWLSAAPAVTVYVDSGGGPGSDGACTDPNGDGSPADDPDGSDNYCTTRAFADALADDGFVWDESLIHWWEPGAAHNEAAWAARVGRPLQWFLVEP